MGRPVVRTLVDGPPQVADRRVQGALGAADPPEQHQGIHRPGIPRDHPQRRGPGPSRSPRSSRRWALKSQGLGWRIGGGAERGQAREGGGELLGARPGPGPLGRSAGVARPAVGSSGRARSVATAKHRVRVPRGVGLGRWRAGGTPARPTVRATPGPGGHSSSGAGGRLAKYQTPSCSHQRQLTEVVGQGLGAADDQVAVRPQQGAQPPQHRRAGGRVEIDREVAIEDQVLPAEVVGRVSASRFNGRKATRRRIDSAINRSPCTGSRTSARSGRAAWHGRRRADSDRRGRAPGASGSTSPALIRNSRSACSPQRSCRAMAME